MCPLRLILIFLSAMFAGVLLMKGLRSEPEILNPNDSSSSFNNPLEKNRESEKSVLVSSKVFSAIASGFWTCLDMASGRYLWRNLSSLSSSKQR